jgi:hypothetical protein
MLFYFLLITMTRRLWMIWELKTDFLTTQRLLGWNIAIQTRILTTRICAVPMAGKSLTT